MKKDLVSILDFTGDEISRLFETTASLKQDPTGTRLLEDKTAALIFEKPSLRTRVTFETGIYQLGGNSVYLAPQDIRLGERESVEDVARNLSRWVDLIVARTFAHATVAGLAEHASVPVINALSDGEHPCQALADFFTILEHHKDLKAPKIVYIGDGNNVCNSFILCGALLGAKMTCAIPEGYDPPLLSEARRVAQSTGARVEVVRSPQDAVKEADVVYTDVWVSMGEDEGVEEKKKVFRPYQVNSELTKACKPNHIVLHCLPAHRGEEITDDVMDGPNSAVLDQAENRLHVQKAIMAELS